MESQEILKWNYGSNKDLANKLISLTLNGIKTATTALYKNNKKIPKIGDLAEIVDENNKSICLIKYTNIEVKPFINVDFSFAIKEGEEDMNIDDWRDKHRSFFSNEYSDFTDSSLVICEEFKVIKVF